MAGNKRSRVRKKRKPEQTSVYGKSAGDTLPARGNTIGQLHIGNETQRTEYIESCLQRMYEGAQELEHLKEEYSRVTAQIYDLDAINALPKDQHAHVKQLAMRIREFEDRQRTADVRDSKMSDQEYARMERLEEEYPAAIRKYEQAEDYHKRIKGDLRKLDNEREAFYLREDDLEKTLAGTHDLSIICMVALCAVLAVLFILQRIFQLQVVYGYMAAILLAAVAIVFLYVRNSNAAKELKTVENSINRLILLQNTVKIRYVNNRNLLDFYELKYGVQKSADLKTLAVRYETERDERIKMDETRKHLARAQQDLLRLLNSLALRFPSMWVRMPQVLTDPSEEKALRTELKGQRKQLRGRMDYNQDKVIVKAKDEIKRLARKYPRYDAEIASQVDAFIREKGISY